MASDNPQYHDILTRLSDEGVEAIENRPVRLLSLTEVLAVKKRAGRPKDLAAIPYIESTIDEIERKKI